MSNSESETCACGADLEGLRELFGDDLEGHITICRTCLGACHVDDGGATCVDCGAYSWVDGDGNLVEGNQKTGERHIVRDVSGEREAFFDGYSFLI